MPRVKETSKSYKRETKDSESQSDTFVFITKDDILKNCKEDQSTDIINLWHPGLSRAALFLFSPSNHTVQEILVFSEDKRSWFIGNNVASNGKLYLSAAIDPVFLILPYLMKSERFQPLDQCLWDEEYPEMSRLIQCQNLDLSSVTDHKGDKSFCAYKFNEQKTLSWLQEKVEKVVEVLKRRGIHVSQGATSANFFRSTKCETKTEIDYLKYAHGIVSHYLTTELSKKLAQYLSLPEEAENSKRKLSSPNDKADEKRSKKDIPMDQEVFVTPESKTKSEKKNITKKELARQKAAAGSKSITSFFKKL